VRDWPPIPPSRRADGPSPPSEPAGTANCPPQDTVADLKERIKKDKRLAPARQRLTVAGPGEGDRPVVLGDDATVASLGSRPVTLKDLGPQVSYQAVFLAEYAAPLALYLAVYAYRFLLPGAPAAASLTQKLAAGYWTLHFAKRLLETLLVHRFSRATMPVHNLLRNVAYYGLCGVFVSWFVNHPLYTAPALGQTLGCLGAALAMQALNLKCHLDLAALRAGGRTGYQVPRGWMFDLVCCPNYTTEILGWALFTAAAQTAAAGIFTAVGAGTMAVWARQKYRRLRSTFSDAEYPRRKVLLPLVF